MHSHTKRQKNFLSILNTKVKIGLSENGNVKSYDVLKCLLHEAGAKVRDALGIRADIAGKSYEVILNPNQATVKTVKGVTRKALSVEVQP